jgi:hypothetical protein
VTVRSIGWSADADGVGPVQVIEIKNFYSEKHTNYAPKQRIFGAKWAVYTHIQSHTRSKLPNRAFLPAKLAN